MRKLRSTSIGASLGRTGKLCSILSALVGALIVAPAEAQQNPATPQPPDHALPADLVKKCSPPGHQIEFVLPATTLYVEFHFLGSGAILDLFHKYGVNCPTGPIKLKSLVLGHGVLRALDIRTGLGAHLLRLRVGGDPSRWATPGAPLPTGRPKTPQPTAPWIEDMNLTPPFQGVFGPGTKVPDSRAYRIHYPGAGDAPGTIVEISCGGEGGGRQCATLHAYAYSGVVVGYTLSQRDLPIPDGAQITSTDPATEPGALLQFDSRFRQWLVAVEQKP